ncbi:hypothetical protein OHR68_12920 [Spirillospora sp. NBC_00431]
MAVTPREIFLMLVNGFCAERWADVVDLYAEQTDVSRLGAPSTLSRGALPAISAADRSHIKARPFPTLKWNDTCLRVDPIQAVRC